MHMLRSCRLFGRVLLLWSVGCVLGLSWAAAGDITGTVYRDFDGDGVVDGGEVGVAGIEVESFDLVGSVDTATTAADGSFTIAGGVPGEEIRLEFNIPASMDYLLPSVVGSNSASLLSFVTMPVDGTDADVDLAVANPGQHCQADPDFVVNCFIDGDQSGTADVLISFPNTASNNTPTPADEALENQIGTTWGLAYQRSSDTLFASSFQKRHAGYGDGGTDGPGAIYAIVDPDDGTATGTSTFLNLNTLFGSAVAGTNPHPTGSDFDLDAASFAEVGKTSFGDLDISDDELTLWVVNLEDRRLYEIPLGTDPANPVAPTLSSQVDRHDLFDLYDCDDDGSPDTGADVDLRPFALKFHDGLVYVGAVCSGESTQDTADLRALVWSFDPATDTFTEVVDFGPLTYSRGLTITGCTGGAADWHFWEDSYPAAGIDQICTFGGNPELSYTQPILSDIEIGADGTMYLGLRDRWGDQQGFNVEDPDGNLAVGDGFGDLLRATADGLGGWTVSTVEATSGTEFFSDDDWTDTSFAHNETSFGGLAQRLGNGEIVYSRMDPIDGTSAGENDFSAGVRWKSTASGATIDQYEVYDPDSGSVDIFGKGNGLGDVEAICEAPPLEIGDRLWCDDGDGVQDPGESGISGVTVSLVCDTDGSGVVGDSGGDLSATTTTSASGQYLFNGSNVTGGIPLVTACEVRVERVAVNGACGAVAVATAVDTNSGSRSDLRDSDGAVLTSGAFDEYSDTIGVAFTTGLAGQSDHSYDFGFQPAAGSDGGELEIVKTSIPTGPLTPGQAFSYEITISNSSSITHTQIELEDALPPGVSYVANSTSVTGPRIFQVRDRFETASFGNQDGRDDWAADWIETDAAGAGTGAGNVTVSGGSLMLDDNPDTGTNPGVAREVDLSGFTTATLDFEFSTSAGVDAGDAVTVDVSNNGGGTYTTLEVITGIAGASTATRSFDISAFIAANTRVRIRVTNTYGGANEIFEVEDLRISASAVADTMRVTEYLLDADLVNDFTGTTYDLTLAQDLAANYFVIVQGSDGTGLSIGGRGPDENYARLTQDPFGTGDLGTSSGTDVLRLERGNAVNTWYGVVTVVECLANCSSNGFQLLDVQAVAHTGTSTSGSDTSGTAWSALSQVMLMGGFNGAGCSTSETTAGDSKVCHARIFPSGSDTINWTRDAGGATLSAATSTVMVLQWGSSWTVERARVQGTNGGNGLNAVGEYNTAAIGNVLRDQTWVWGTGHTDDNGVGDAAEGAIITLGNGVDQNATESTVAVGLEAAGNAVDFEVYALSHPDLAVDYRFKTDGNTADVTVDVTVDSATSDRMALSYNGSSSTNNAYPRPMFSARYVGDTTVRLERRRTGTDFPAWVQGIDFSALGVTLPDTADNALGGNPQLLDGTSPNLVEPGDGFELAPGDSMTITFDVVVDSPLAAGITGFTCPATADSAEGLPVSDSTYNPVGLPGIIGDFVWYDLDGDGLQDTGEPGIANVQVNLHASNSCDSPVIESTTTNDFGFYFFDDLAAGDYCVQVYEGTLPDDYALTTASNPLTLTLGAGATDQTIDFGYNAAACLPAIDFETDGEGNAMLAGQIVDNEYAPFGVTVSVTGGSNQAMIFDTNNPTGGDTDLGSPHTDFGGPGVGTGGAAGATFENRFVLDNVLIASTDGDSTDPDDHAGGATFTFSFDRDLQVDELGFLDNGDTLGVDGGEIRLFDATATQIGGGIVIPGVGDNGTVTVGSIGGSGVRSVEVELFGAGSIDAFVFCAAPTADGALGDRVWLDIDGDGVQDIGEPGLPNVEVTLYDAGPDLMVGGGDDVAVATLITDAAGLYLFTDLPASTFYVEVTDATVPAGLSISPGSTDPGATVALASGAIDLDSDFGYRNAGATAIIGDTVWADADGDGLLDAGEPGIAGVSLDLLSPGVDGVLGTGDDVVEDTVTTDADGRYLFTGVAPGKYVVDVTDTGGALTGYTLTVGPQSNPDPTYPILVAAGDVYLQADFGYDNPSLFMIDDTAWLDLDRDGIFDVGEQGIAGVTVALLDAAGEVVASTISDSNGDFVFTGLTNGDYTVVITDTMSKLAKLSTTTSPAAAGEQAVTIAGSDVSGTNFGYVRPGVIGDRVWSDANSDGIQDDNEVGIAGVTVEIYYDVDSDGVLNTGTDTQVATAVTDAFGNYLFEDLYPGTYVVSIDDTQGALTGYSHTTLDSQAAAGDQLDSGLSSSVDSDLDNDFGYVDASLPDVSGNVFHDIDRDGVDDGVGEPGILGVTIALVDASGNVVATTRTDAAGDYLFPDVPAGDYTVTVTDQEEVLDDYFLTSGLDAIDITVVATDITDIDFGYARRNTLGRIGDFVWLDADRDGVQDLGEPGLPNVDLDLYDAGPDRALGGGDDVLVASTTTDANGGYIFVDLPAGNYYVDVDGATVPSGLSATTGTTDPSRLVNLSAGEVDLDVDFGYAGTTNSSALGDRVWVDADSDGIQDAGEVGIEGVTVTVVGPSGSFTEVTGPGGFYLVTGLSAGTYTVTVDSSTLPAGLNTVPTNSPASREFEVPATSDVLTADFGFDAPGGVLGTIGDFVFLDLNADGVQDAGEQGIEGVTLNLLDASGDVISTMTTDENGGYDFSGLLAANYRVDVTDLAGVLVGLNLSAGSDPTASISLAAGQDYNNADFGYSPAAMVGSLGNLVWHDINGDGNVDSGEPGLGGVTIDLWVDVDGNGSITAGVDNYLRSVTTDSNGEYEFKGLIPAVYLVDVTDTAGVLSGFNKTTGIVGVDDNSQADPYQVTLNGGAPSNVTADFGYEAAVPFNLSGTVFIDGNQDALFNGAEAGVSGVPVRLFRDLDGDGVLDPGEPQIGTATSDGNGDYSFSNLPNGDYIVTVVTSDTAIEGFSQTTQTGTASVQPATIAGADSVDNDFGFIDASPAPLNPGAIGDRVWLDIDADGVQDIGEPGIANVQVRLFDVGLDGAVGGGDDVLLDTLITDMAGEYLFPGLATGTYYVDVVDATVPTGLSLSPGGSDPTAAITLVADQVYLLADFGYSNADPATAIIGNFVWSDADNDGLQDPGEPGIGNVTVDLVGPGADGILGTGDDTVEATQTTADDGSYLFISVPPGEYRVDVTDTNTALTGYTLTSGPQSNTDPTQPLSVLAGEVYLDADFGYVNGALFSISDRTWHDIDGDGTQDIGEPAFSGVTVSLLDASGDVVATTTTDSNGDFQFDGLPNGSYTLSITDTDAVLLEYVGTTAPATADSLDVTVAGADVSGINFGYNIPGQIGDRVWSDADGDGVQDAGEPGIAGVTVQLWLDDGDGIFDNTVDTLVDTQVTDGTGLYLFEQLGQGTYFSSIDDGQAALSGYTPTTTDQEGGANAPGTQIEASLATSAASFLDADFGYQQPALPDVSGNVFNDLDRDGVDDGAVDVGIAGVSIDLVNSSGEVVATTTTDVDGDYAFLDVAAGDYTVTVTDSGGVLEDYFLTSGLDAIDITVVATDITDIDFGYARDSGTASIGDFVWFDGDDDGIQDGAEPGIGSVDVDLYNAGPDGAVGGGDDVLVASTSTDNNGLYLFEGLSAGTYYVDVVDATVPAGLGLSTGSTDPSDLISLSEEEDYRDADFGYSGSGGSALGDFIWYDADSDGEQDSGELGLAGVTVELRDVNNVFITSAVTDSNGLYLFTGLAAATYRVVVLTGTLPAGVNTTPTNIGGTDLAVPMDGVTDFLFADWGFDGGTLGSIGDTVFLDTDGDGVQDAGEGGIEGVTLNLLDSLGETIGTAVTDENGVYDFQGLLAGNYRVQVTDTGGVLADLNLSAGSNPTAAIALASGQDYDDADFPYTPSSGLGTLGNLVWHDIDNSGDVDAGEPGMQGVTVDLWLDVNSDGIITPGIDNFLRTETTDENGEYEFNSLPPSDYLVTVSDDFGVLTGFTKTSGMAGVDDNSQADPYAVTLSSGTPNNLTADFGYFAAADLNISGTTFFDLDGDGTYEPSVSPNDEDFGVDTTLVLLFRDLNGDGMLDGGDALIDSKISDVNGDYLFANLPPGDYIVAVDATGTYVDGATQTTQLATLSVQPVILVAADSVDNDFGFNRPATSVFASHWRAFVENGRLVVEWQTTGQANTAGFHLYRLDTASGRQVLVSGGAMLPALTTAPQGAIYQVDDATAPSQGRLSYLLVEVETGGFEQIYGPFEVTVRGGLDVSLPGDEVSAGYRVAARQPTAAMRQRLAEHRLALDTATGTSVAPTGTAKAVAEGRAMQLRVRADGLHRVSDVDLANGLNLSLEAVRGAVRNGQLKITLGGQTVAWRAIDEAGRGLVFYGQAIDSLYTLDNVYRVVLGAAAGLGERSVETPATNSGASYRHRLHLEEDLFAATFAATDPELDYWHWKGIFAAHPTLGSADFEVEVPHVVPDDSSGQVTVYLVSASDSGVADEHHAEIAVNGLVVGETSWQGLGHHQATLDLPPFLLQEGTNELTVTGLLDGQASQSLFYVDAFDLDYERRFRAVDDRLLADSDGQRVLTLEGFSGPDIIVLDISDALRPTLLTGHLVEQVGDSYRTSLELSEVSRLWAGLVSQLPQAATRRDVPSDWLNPFNGADYMVIAPDELLAGAAELAAYHQAEMETVVVSLSDVMDEVNHGVFDPRALRQFLANVQRNWRRAPEYVVLLGAGHFDYRDLGGLGGNAMPPLMVATPYGLYASDVRLADIDGDGRPEMSIGRLPVLSNEEVSAYVQKLEAYERSSSAAGWVSKVLLAADDEDSGGRFHDESDVIAGLLPSALDRQTIYLGETAVPVARQQLLDALGDGLALVNYVGHGGLDGFAAEGLLTVDDVAGLRNGGRLPLVVSLTCNVGRFEVPGFTALGEELVLHDEGGAVAVIAPSGLSLDFEAHRINQALVEAAYGGAPKTMGQIHRQLLEAYAEEGNTFFIGQIYLLLGDPATPFVRP